VTADKPRRRADAARNIAAIVESGLELFGTRSNVRMADVAAEAGVGRVTLYAHFPSREKLLEAVVERALAEAHDLLQVDDFDTEPADVLLARMVRTSWHTLDRYRRLRAVAQAELSEQRLREHHDRADIADRLRRLVTRGQRQGVFRSDLPSEWLVTTTFSLLHAAADEVNDGRLAPSDAPDVLEATLSAVLAPPPGEPPDALSPAGTITSSAEPD
jgi:AcrR family transcriptional regulator